MLDLMPLQLTFRQRRAFPLCPDTVPMELLDEATAKRNHDQSLERLAERGGVSPSEAIALMDRRPWCPIDFQEAGEEIMRRMLSYRPHPQA